MDPQSAQPTSQSSPQVPQSDSPEKKSKMVPILLVGLVIIILVVIGEVIYLVLSDSEKINPQPQNQTQSQNQSLTQSQNPDNQLGNPDETSFGENLPTKTPYSHPEFNDERTSDVNSILDAVLRYREDNNGSLPPGVTQTPQEISSTGINICSVLVPQYMSGIPIDPVQNNKVTEVTDCNDDYNTGYAISVSGENVIITIADENSLDNIKAQQ